MRILLALAVIVVFAAMMVFDTAALLRLVGICVTGGCGVSVRWIAIGGGVLALAAVLVFWRTGGNTKKAPVRKAAARSRPARGKAPAKRKPKPAK